LKLFTETNNDKKSKDDPIFFVAATKRKYGCHSLRYLISHIPKDYRIVEAKWGIPVGREEW
jgi:hypothetical protein